MLGEINWKVHRPHDKPINRKNLVEQLVDIFKYWNSIVQFWDVSPSEFIDEFNRKSEVVEQRFKQEKHLHLIDDKFVVCIDIDGVLADYPNYFIKFVEGETGIKFGDLKIRSPNITDVLGEVLPGGREAVRALKHKYRMDGYKRTIPVVAGAAEVLQRMKTAGLTIVLLSARPYKIYPRIFADTIEWLKVNSMPYDAIIWDENKEERMLKQLPNMMVMFEDNAKNALDVASAGKKVYLIDRTYNRGVVHDNITRFGGWGDIVIDGTKVMVSR
jgi:uncharacterized HAD superfamily protein